MNWTLAIIQAIVIAGMSAAISYFVSIRQKRIDLVYDYKRYILERRKEAYKKVEIVLNSLVLSGTGDDASFRFYDRFEDFDRPALRDFNRTVAETATSNIWLGHDTRIILSELNELLSNQIFEIFDSNDYSPENVRRVGARDHKKTDAIIRRLTNAFIADVISLDDIEKFKKRQH